MEYGWFDRPVPISLGISALGITSDVYNVSNARQAAEILLNRWPAFGTPKHRDARYACLRVLQGIVKPEVAREAFVEAAREAGILFEEYHVS